jgi:autotransporter translocation and assembly factor TamB
VTGRARLWLLWLVVLLALGLGLGVLALSQTAAVRQRAHGWIETRLQETLRREVRVDGVRIQPWAGRVDVSGIRVASGRSLGQGIVFSAEAIQARWSWTALLRRQVIFRHITLVRPRFTPPAGAAPGLGLQAGLSWLLRPRGVESGGWVLRVRRASVVDGQAVWTDSEGMPVRVEGLEGAFTWSDEPAADGTSTVQLQAAHLTIAHSGRTHRLDQIHLQANGTAETVTVAATTFLLAGARVTAHGRIASPVRDPRLDLELGVQAPLTAVLALLGSDRQIDGTLGLDGRLEGPWEQAAFQGTGRLQLGKEGEHGEALPFSLGWGDGRVEVATQGGAAGRDGSFEGVLSLTPTTGVYQVRARLTNTNLAALAGLPLGLPWWQGDVLLPPEIRGRLTGDVDLSGQGADLTTVRGQAAFSVEDLALKGETPSGRFEARIAATGSRLEVETFTLRTAGGEIRGRGGLSVSTGRLHLPFRANVWDVGTFARGFGATFLKGQATLAGRLTGTPEAPHLLGRLTWREAQIAGQPFDLIQGDIDVAHRLLRTTRLLARTGGSTAMIRGSLQALGTTPLRRLNPMRDLALDIQGNLRPARTDDFVSLLPEELAIRGAFRAAGRIAGTLESLTGEVEVSLANVQTWEESWRRGEALFQFRQGGVEISRILLRRRAEQLTGQVTVEAGGALRGRLTSTAMNVARIGSLSGAHLGGQASFRLDIQGTLQDTVTLGEVTASELAYKEIPLGPATATFKIERKAVDVDLALRDGTHRLRLSVGPPSDRSVKGELTLTDADLDLFVRLAEIEVLRDWPGRGSGRILFRGPARTDPFASGEAEFSRVRLSQGEESWENRGPVRVSWSGPVVTLRQMRLGSGQEEFDLRGTLSEDGQSDLTLTGQLPLMALARVLPVMHPTGGVAEANLQLRGRRSALEPHGTLEIQRGRFSLPGVPAEFREARVRLSLEGNLARIRDWQAQLAEGRFRGAGEVGRGAGGWKLRLTFQENGGRAEQLLSGLYGGKGEVTGSLSLGGILTSQGENAADFWRNLSGDLALAMREGRIGHYTVTARILALLNMAQLLELKGPEPAGEGMPYQSLTSDIKIAGGVARTENLVLESRAMKVNAVGQVNLAEDTVDLTVAVKPFQNLDRIITRIPVAGWLLGGKEQSLVVAYYEVTGPLRDPQVTPIPLKSVGRNIFGIFRNLLEIPEALSGPYEDLPPQPVKPDEDQKK